MAKNCFPAKLLLASPRGFCAGVKRAISTLNEAIIAFPDQTIYCYHQIVHNSQVVKEFEEKGVKFVDSVEDVPEGAVLILSSHGVSPTLREEAQKRNLHLIDATCPFVAKTHLEMKKYASDGLQIIYVGQSNHDEAIGTTGEAPTVTHLVQSTEDIGNLPLSKDSPVALVTQTTLSFDETEKLRQSLKKTFSNLVEPSRTDICQATQNRQNGVKELIKKGAQAVIVLGSPHSSNSVKLKKTAENAGAQAYLVDGIDEINPTELTGLECIGLTAGASLPEKKINQALRWLKKQGVTEVEEVIVADESRVTLPTAIIR